MAINPPIINHTPRRREYSNPLVQIVLLLLVLGLLSWFVVKPKYSQTMEKRTELKASEDLLSQTKTDNTALDTLISKLHTSKDNLALLDEALPLNGRVSKADLLIESLVQSSGMTLVQISPGEVQKSVSAGDKAKLKDPFQKPRTLTTTTFTLSLSGSIDQFNSLLSLLEKNGRVIDVDSIDISGGDSGSKFQVVLKTYAYDGTSTPSTTATDSAAAGTVPQGFGPTSAANTGGTSAK